MLRKGEIILRNYPVFLHLKFNRFITSCSNSKSSYEIFTVSSNVKLPDFHPQKIQRELGDGDYDVLLPSGETRGGGGTTEQAVMKRPSRFGQRPPREKKEPRTFLRFLG